MHRSRATANRAVPDRAARKCQRVRAAMRYGWPASPLLPGAQLQSIGPGPIGARC
jgi:hypothetical protein